MPNPPAIKSLHLRNILSFGEPAEPLELGPLNVLIGSNGAGKSNLIEALSLLKNLSRDWTVPIREGGGGGEWLWKGQQREPASIELVMSPLHFLFISRVRYYFSFHAIPPKVFRIHERIESVPELPVETPTVFFMAIPSQATIRSGDTYYTISGGDDYDFSQSVLSQRKDTRQFPEVTLTGRFFESLHLYREWHFGRNSPARRAQPADLPNNYLEEDGSNLGLILNKLRQNSQTKRQFIEYLRTFYEEAEDVDVLIEANTVQVFLHEKSFPTPIPATRLSDGTLKWISLLAILLHPTPPPLVCIEEPDIGLHPDMMPTLAKLLREASERMQLIVTTHSDALVDALSDTPECIIVCEKENGATRMKRLSREDLSVWLEKYGLGELWRRGEIGGNRW
jgi:predicted ATPase